MTEKPDVYSRVTVKIIADLERGNLTWLQPWQAGHQAGPVCTAPTPRSTCAGSTGLTCSPTFSGNGALSGNGDA
jgi:antirestriction protein ArdC